MEKRDITWDEAAERLMRGDVGVIPTDTLYGIVGSALKPQVVERIYELRKRERDKPLIVLCDDAENLGGLQIRMSGRTQELCSKIWPGPVSVIVALEVPGLEYLHRGTRSLAVRVPAKPELKELLTKVGPLVAPSANWAGEPPAQTVDEARHYFGDEVFYVDWGRLEGLPSALVDTRGPVPRVLRPGPGYSPSDR